GRIQGTSDVSVLTLDGISQAAALGAYVARRQVGDATNDDDDDDDDDDEDIGIVSSSDPPPPPPEKTMAARAPPITRTWCSPLTRCRQTYAVSVNDNDESPLLPPPRRSVTAFARSNCASGREDCVGRSKCTTGENWNAFVKDPTSLRLDDGKFAPVLDCWERTAAAVASSSEFVSIDDADSSDAALASKRVSSSSTSSTTTTKDDDSDVGDDDDDDNDNDNDTAAAAAANGAVFVMCHGAMLNCMLLRAVGMDVDAYGKSRECEFDNCDCVEVEWYDDDEISMRWRRVHPRGDGGWRCTATAIASMRRMGGMRPSSGGGGPPLPSRSEEISDAFAIPVVASSSWDRDNGRRRPTQMKMNYYR
ncbi:hypothetical protein ACHAW5_006342, partial [Stephanodiscus triporus]